MCLKPMFPTSLENIVSNDKAVSCSGLSRLSGPSLEAALLCRRELRKVLERRQGLSNLRVTTFEQGDIWFSPSESSWDFAL